MEWRCASAPLPSLLRRLQSLRAVLDAVSECFRHNDSLRNTLFQELITQQGSSISTQVTALSQTVHLLKQDIAQQKLASEQLLQQSRTNEQTVMKNLQHLDQRLTLMESRMQASCEI